MPPANKKAQPSPVMTLPSLKDSVRAAQKEVDMAVVFHEAWKPAAYDLELHKRLISSYAAHTFNAVRLALRREMLMALMRIWDYTDESIRIGSVIDGIQRNEIVDALLEERLTGLSKQSNMCVRDFETQMRHDIQSSANEAIFLFKQYIPEQPKRPVLDNLRQLRHEHLAHHQVNPTNPNGPAVSDLQIETFYQDTATLISKLLHVVLGVAHDFSEAAESLSMPSGLFWASVRGERTEGHPEYRLL